jgi:transcriptional regulator with XRE-family HTH domain
MAGSDIIAHQVAMYGEPLSARFGRLLTGYGLSQSRLAAVIGLSPPMLSQLMSGQREKISNPAVLGRVVRLEELLTPAIASADPIAIAALLDEVAGSRPTLSTMQVQPSGTTPAQRAAQALAEAADAKTLRSAASRLGPGPLAEILVAAADFAAAAAGTAASADHAAAAANGGTGT